MFKHYYILFISFVLIISCQNKQSDAVTVEQYRVSSETLSKEIVRVQTNSEESMQKPYVVLISIDGFKYDYVKKYDARTLNAFQVSAEHMISSFPTKTFPNHYTIVTGLYPGNHGLISNTFYDRSKKEVYRISDRTKVEDPTWYGGTPLWVLASQQQMVSASMFWVGSEAAIQGVFPTYYFKYDGSISHSDRVNKVMQWLALPEERRPHLITLYFSSVDSDGHNFGPDSDKIMQSVQDIDATMGDLMTKIEDSDLPVNVIVVSDHGMLEISQEKPVNISDYIDTEEEIVTLSMPAMIYSENDELMEEVYQKLSKESRLKVYLKDELPAEFHYSASDRIGDLVIMPKPPHIISNSEKVPSPGSATHGWNPNSTPDMNAIFYANGPAFKSNMVIKAFENIHVYPMVATILELEFDPSSIDGKKEVLKPILKSN